jgi:RNA polymerase sigma-70 factor (ECF subfamily)
MSTNESRIPPTDLSMLGKLGPQPAGTREVRDSNLAWTKFYQIYGPVIYRFSRRTGLDQNEADEVLARVMRNFLTAFRNGLVVIESKGRFRSYLRTVTNRVIQAVRSERPRGEEPGAAEPAAMQRDDWETDELRSMLLASLQRLRELGVSSRDIGVFEELVLQQRTPESVSACHGVSVARVYVIKHEMIKRVRNLYRKLRGILGAGES